MAKGKQPARRRRSLTGQAAYRKAAKLYRGGDRKGALDVVNAAIAAGALEITRDMKDRETARKLAHLRVLILHVTGAARGTVKEASTVAGSLGIPALVRFLPENGESATADVSSYSLRLTFAFTCIENGLETIARKQFALLRSTFLADDNQAALSLVRRRLKALAARDTAHRKIALELTAQFVSHRH